MQDRDQGGAGSLPAVRDTKWMPTLFLRNRLVESATYVYAKRAAEVVGISYRVSAGIAPRHPPHHRTCGFAHPAVEPSRLGRGKTQWKQKSRAAAGRSCSAPDAPPAGRHPPGARRLVATPSAVPVSPNRRRLRKTALAVVHPPEALSNIPADPLLQSVDGSPRLGQSEISPPASGVAVHSSRSLVARATAATVPQLRTFALNLSRLSGAIPTASCDPVESPGTCVPRPSPSRSWRHSPSIAGRFPIQPVRV